MANYSFRLTPGYCLYNGIAVLRQNGAHITFMIENLDNEDLQRRIRKAFCNHVDYVNHQSDCPDVYKEQISIDYRKCSRVDLKKTVSNFYKESNQEFGSVADRTEAYNSEKRDKKNDDEAAAVLLLDSILNEARTKEVSDIHIEQNEIKFRNHGKLEKQMQLPPERCLEVVQRIKLLSGMNVIENRRSQDGRFIFDNKNPLYVRASSVPIVSKSESGCCESIVLRLLDPCRVPFDFNQLGFNKKQIERMELIQGIKDGLIIICGPTGAGKSTTAATLLNQINNSFNGQKKIISLEDPPEFIIPGVTQLRIDENQNNTFEELLNHIFRQDPDVIMVGEIRDEKSAAAALRASLTGHLVVATLHTSSASGALLRLENLGLERKLLVSVLRGIIVQELETIGRELVLMAEVCFPCEGFSELCTSDKGQSAIEAMFDVESNGGDVLAKSLEVMKSKQLIENSFEDFEITEESVSRKRKKRNLFVSSFGDSIDVKQEA